MEWNGVRHAAEGQGVTEGRTPSLFTLLHQGWSLAPALFRLMNVRGVR